MQFYDDFYFGLSDKVKTSLGRTVSRIRSFARNDFIEKNLFDASVHLLRSEGKLLRPTLLFLGADVLGEPHQKYIDLAASVELLHVSSLIHDDIIDAGVARRNVKSVNLRYGDELAILAGDALISKAIGFSAKYGPDVVGALSDAALRMCAGESLDYSCQNGKKMPTTKDYTKIAALKSGSITGASCAAVATHKEDRLAQELYDFGSLLGVGFQIRDDILDFIEAKHTNAGSKALGSNIVAILKGERGLNTESALMKAAKMNRSLVDRAVLSLKTKRAREYFEPYALMIRTDF